MFLHISILHFPHVQGTFFISVICGTQSPSSCYRVYIHFTLIIPLTIMYLTNVIFLLHVHLYQVDLWTAPASFYVLGFGSLSIS